ncbi:carbohydrate deacetylase [Hufsiella ginkgonis]|uniref:ChbG/HpnK family deacetylase n=1 Tax=Hufsiella ginkgonis TaxID=2695274 RepID=A0A7K1Y2E3_9SPHI|nr:ChbG/HpnK family deacetylase [Hufsiella ginkgonis]MXV17435.1 ChbG/HpnK family deacetylase [Hufsiella ginkgonis]
MNIPPNLLVNADDLGLNPSVNRAIAYCFEKGYINSTSLLTNTVLFEETVALIRQHASIKKVGVHVNFSEGKPVSDFRLPEYLDETGNWNIARTNKKLQLLSAQEKAAFYRELEAQVNRAIAHRLPVMHLDSHYHLHTLPAFLSLFITAAKKYNLKLRLAQTFNEGNYLKFAYRKYVNRQLKRNNLHYTDYFETVEHLLKNNRILAPGKMIEIMLHPGFDANDQLTDHYDAGSMVKWLNFLNKS